MDYNSFEGINLTWQRKASYTRRTHMRNHLIFLFLSSLSNQAFHINKYSLPSFRNDTCKIQDKKLFNLHIK